MTDKNDEVVASLFKQPDTVSLRDIFVEKSEQVYEATVTIRVRVTAKNSVHARKIIEGGISTALNVLPIEVDIDTQG